MAVFHPFQAVRPKPEYAARIAALPYDVMNSAEARAAVVGNPYSFLHVDKAEIDLDESVDLYDDAVYAKGFGTEACHHAAVLAARDADDGVAAFSVHFKPVADPLHDLVFYLFCVKFHIQD